MAGDRAGLSLRSLGLLGAVKRASMYSLVMLSNATVYPLSKVFPRDRRRLVFGSPSGRFEGNSKYLFLWMNTHPTPFETAWVSENKSLVSDLKARGFKAFTRWSIGGIWEAARAGTYVVNDNGSDVNFPLSGGAKIFNLWHGIGLKNVNRGATIGYGASLKKASRNPLSYIRSMRRLQRPHWILATSQHTAQHFFARCFELPVSRAPALGYPRLDPIHDAELRALGSVSEDYSGLDVLASNTRAILYVPTLRIRDEHLLATALPDLPRLSAALARQNAVLHVKLHPKTQRQKGIPELIPENIRFISDSLDIYPILNKFDAIITDFSSLYFEYLAVKDGGINLYPFDFKEYISTNRDLAYDYDEVSVGSRVDTFSELCVLVETGSVFDPADLHKLDALRQQFWGGSFSGTTASERASRFLETAEDVR